MIDQIPECEGSVGAGRKTRLARYGVLGAVCALVIGLYAWSAKSGRAELGSLNAANTYYNLLVQGFHAGQLNVKKEVPSGLAQLPDSHDQVADSLYQLMDYQLLDLSYYKGKWYLYFGVTPALVMFWPYVAVTGHYLLHQDAVVISFSVSFLASVGLLWAVWRRYFAEMNVGVVAAGTLSLGLANLTPAILQRCDVYEVPISCGCALTMVTLTLVWQAMHARRGRVWWLAAASLAYGLALGARPSLLFGAVILLVPVARIWRARAAMGLRPQLWTWLLAATGPITVIGLGLMLYNFLRFDNPLEFGQRYQVPGTLRQQFSLHYLWFNFRVCFLEPARWGSCFPFVQDIVVPPLPRGSGGVFEAFGVLTNIPVVWLALAAPLAWRNRLAEVRSALRGLVAAVALLFGTGALIILLHDSMCLRYEVEFACTLVLLAVMGIFGLERALAGRRVWRLAARWGWGLLLAFSVSFNLFVMFEQSSESYVCRGAFSFHKGQLDEAIVQFQKALQIQPDNAKAHTSLGVALLKQDKAPEAIGHLEQAVRLRPDYADAHYNLGTALFQLGRVAEAVGYYEQALQLKPEYAKARNNLGTALFRLGKVAEAIKQYGQALRLDPEYAEARESLGVALFQLGEGLAAQGKWDEAIRHYERAVEMKPDNAQAYDSLGLALSRVGRFAAAVGCYQKALAIDARLITAQNNLAWLLATCADGSVRDGMRAVELAEGANRLAGGKDAAILDTLAAAYAEAGRFGEAVGTAQRAIELVQVAGQAEPAGQIQARLQLYQAGRPYHEGSVSVP